VHAPAWQAPSEHIVPSAFTGLEHAPVIVSQVPVSWHSSGTEQTTGVPAVHVPAWQTSVWVQALPSSQDELSALVGLEHAPVPGLQAPGVWH
jgi:hypothetical protein